MPVSEQTRKVIAHLKTGRVISLISAPTRRLADARSLILLSQMVYWTTRDKRVPEADGWFSKPSAEWGLETGLSRSYVASCVRTLQEQRIIKVWQRKAKTAPWYKLNLGQLYVLCQGRPPEAEIPLPQFIADASFRESIVGRPLPYYTLLTNAVGDALLGLFLSRCVYWQEALEQRNRLNEHKPTWGWSSNDWANDIGISRTQLRMLLKQASDLGLIEVTIAGRPFPGIWVDFERVCKAINMPGTECPVHTVDGAFCATSSHILLAAETVGFEQPTAKSAHSEHGFAQCEDGFEQSTRARGVDYRDYGDNTTTTTDPPTENSGRVVVGDSSEVSGGNSPALIFSALLAERELPGIRRTIALALPLRRQALLDELDECLRRGLPRNALSYLRGLVNRDNQAQGNLILEYAHLAEDRREREARLEKQKALAASEPKATQAFIPLAPEKVQQHLQRAKAALKPRLNQLSPTEEPA